MKKLYITSFFLALFGIFSITSFGQIVANDDNYTNLNGLTGDSTTSVYLNDTLNGNAINPSDVEATLQVTIVGISINSNGQLVIPPGTPNGTYTIIYYVCEIATTSNCDSAVVVLSVIGNTIIANPDTLIFTTQNGIPFCASPNVLTNDTINGNAATTANVTVTAQSTISGITLSSNGDIIVASGTTPGTYNFNYQICPISSGAFCSYTTATITIQPNIIANTDVFSYTPGIGSSSTSPSVLLNDILNSVAVNPSQVIFTPITSSNGLFYNEDGTLTPSSSLSTGTYTSEYEICELTHPNNCSIGTVTYTITQPFVNAVNDTFSNINGQTGATNFSFLENDTLGVANNLNPTVVNLTVGTLPAGFSVNVYGLLTIPPGTPFGSYTFTYQICDLANPTNCDSATVTVIVNNIIDAVDDFYTVPTSSTPVFLGDFTSNDTINGVVVSSSQVTILNTAFDAGISPSGIAGDNSVILNAGTIPGTYILAYQLCEVLNSANCDFGSVTVSVVNPSPPLGLVSQTVAAGSTLANLVVSGENILWYNSETGKNATSTPLPLSTVLVDGTTYYASQTINGYESTNRLPVTVTLSALSTGNFVFTNFNHYPNPVTNSLTISNNSTIDYVEVMSILGQKIMRKNVNDLQTTINLSQLSKGIYFVKVSSEGQEKILEIVKE